MNCDFLMERKLKEKAPELSKIYRDNVACCVKVLNRFRAVFPTFTDHSALHSLEVISFVNRLIGENIERMNADEIFVLLIAAYLHDVGMGISEKEYEEFSPMVEGLPEYLEAHPEATKASVIRAFHNEFSGLCIKKYAKFFDFPTEEHAFAVIEVSRGHRKTDLFDKKEYPDSLCLPNGNKLCLPYLTALIRLADELDIAADRNLLFMYDPDLLYTEKDKREFAKHRAIRSLDVEDDRFLMRVDGSDPQVLEELFELRKKVNDTLVYCRDVVAKRSAYSIRQERVDMEVI